MAVSEADTGYAPEVIWHVVARAKGSPHPAVLYACADRARARKQELHWQTEFDEGSMAEEVQEIDLVPGTSDCDHHPGEGICYLCDPERCV